MNGEEGVRRSPFSVLVISATLILFPIAFSPVSSDPAGAGRLTLLLTANFILYLVLAVKELRKTGEQLQDKQINGEETPFLRSSVLRPPFVLLLALVLTLILLLISPNRTVALAGEGAKVIPVLLFYLAARRLLYGKSIVTNIFFSVIPANAGIQKGSNSIDSGSVARNDKKEDGIKAGFEMTRGLSMVKKAWVIGMVLLGVFYLLFASPLSRRLNSDPVSGQPSKLPPSLARYYQTAAALAGPQFNLTRPDGQTSLKVAVETLTHSPLTGAGLGRYSGAFSAYRGSAFNYTPLWNLKFTSSFSTLFNWVTEGGMVGMVIYLLILTPAVLILLNSGQGLISKINPPAGGQISNLQSKNKKDRLPFPFYFLRCIFDLLYLRFDILLVTGLALSSLYFSFGLAGYFYLLGGYLFLGGAEKDHEKGFS